MKTLSFISCLLLFAFSGCNQLLNSGSARAYERGQEASANGHYERAVSFFEAALDGTSRTADIHYRMALIYDNHLNQPASALYHYQRYLALQPDGKHAGEAKNLIKQDKFELLNILSNGSILSQHDAARMKNEDLALRQEIIKLRAKITTIVQSIPKSEITALTQKKPIPSGARTYIVQRGDTFASISKKFYNNPHRWLKIQRANFEHLGNQPVILKVGMKLCIP